MKRTVCLRGLHDNNWQPYLAFAAIQRAASSQPADGWMHPPYEQSWELSEAEKQVGVFATIRWTGPVVHTPERHSMAGTSP